MIQRTRQAAALTVLALTVSAGCRTDPRSQPGDPMLDAIRAEERQENLTYVENQGRRLFVHYCATCHGDEAKGDGQNASNLTPPPPDLTSPKNARDAALIRKVITDGSAAVGRSSMSPPWGRTLSRQQIEYLVAYCQAVERRKP